MKKRIPWKLLVVLAATVLLFGMTSIAFADEQRPVIKSITYDNSGESPKVAATYSDADGNMWIEVYTLSKEPIKEGDPKTQLGFLEIDGVPYHMLGIMTIDPNNPEQFKEGENGEKVIATELYTPDGKPPAGEEVQVVIETGSDGDSMQKSEGLLVEVPEEGKQVTVESKPSCAHENTRRTWDAQNHWDECLNCGAILNENHHTLKAEWASNSDGHYRECSVVGCGYTSPVEEHDVIVDWSWNDELHWQECSVCKAVISGPDKHVMIVTNTETSHSKECSECHYAEVSVQPHTWEWQGDENEHWKKCSFEGCGYIDEESRGKHETFGEINFNEKEHWTECKICGLNPLGPEAHQMEFNHNNEEHFKACANCRYEDESTKEKHTLVLVEKSEDELHFMCTVCEKHMYRRIADLNEATVTGLEEGKEEYTREDLDKLGLEYEGKTLKPGEDYTVTTEETEDSLKRVFKGIEDQGFKGVKEVVVVKSGSKCSHEDTDNRWDDNNHWTECLDCHAILNLHPHAFPEEWVTESTYHWRDCTAEGCSYRSVGDHVVDPLSEMEYDDVNHWRTCTICGGKDVSAHRFDGFSYDDKQHWQECAEEDCGYITDRVDHIWVKGSHGADGHFDTCVCNIQINEEPHKWTFDWDDERHWKICTECDYEDEADSGPHTLVLDYRDGDDVYLRCSHDICSYRTVRHARYLDKARVTNLEEGKYYTQEELDELELWHDEAGALKKGDDYTVEKVEDEGDLWRVIFKGVEDKGVIGEKEITVPKRCGHPSYIVQYNGDMHWKVCNLCRMRFDEENHAAQTKDHDDRNHWFNCSCGARLLETPHVYDAVDHNGSKHWGICTFCGNKSTEEDHYFDAVYWDTGKHWDECSYCGQTANEEDHSLVYEPIGVNTHWRTCSDPSCAYVESNSEEECASATWEADANEHWGHCDRCGQEVNRGAHDENGWDGDVQQHWKACSICNLEVPGTREEHSYEKAWNDAVHYDQCTVCNHIANQQVHTEKPDHNEWSHWYYCTEMGCDWESVHESHIISSISHFDSQFHYFQCSVCHANGSGNVGQFRREHNLVYGHDENNHWRKCTVCAYTSPAEPHEWKLEAVKNNAAVIQCDDCGESKTLALKDVGDIEIDVRSADDAPGIRAILSAGALAGLITAEDEQAMENGATLYIYMTAAVLDVSEVPEEDLAVISAALQDAGFAAGLYVDLSLFRQLDENEPVRVDELAGDGANIEMDMPEELRTAPEGFERIFRTWTARNGEANLLSEGTDPTQRFTVNSSSTFVIAYQDVPKAE